MIDDIIKYEQGELTDQETIELFATLVKSGMCWQLQGHYGRTAQCLIENEYLDTKGNILIEL